MTMLLSFCFGKKKTPSTGTTGATKKEDTVTADDVSGAKEEQVEEEEQEQAGEIEKEGVSARRRPRRET